MLNFIFILWIGLCVQSASGETQAEQQQALDEVAQSLTNPEQRKKVISEDKKAKEADDFAAQVAGSPKIKEEIYQLSSDIFKTVGQKNELDANKMEKMLEEGQRDPAGFLNKLTPEQREKIKNLGLEVEQQQRSKVP